MMFENPNLLNFVPEFCSCSIYVFWIMLHRSSFLDGSALGKQQQYVARGETP